MKSLRFVFFINYYGDELKEKRTGVVHNAHGEVRNTRKILVGQLDARRPVERLGIEGLILKLIFRKLDMDWAGFMW
jgi:hypothetical protein